jgi:two-component system LytT family response regulator
MERAIIIEDEINIRKGLIALLEDHCPSVQIVGEAATVEEAIEEINKSRPDLIFLDIHLPDGTGFDVLKAISPSTIKVIFITAFSEYALKAIKYSAIDYILKPVIPDELIEAVEKATELIEHDQHFFELNLQQTGNGNSKPSKLVIKTKTEVFYFDIDDIVYCQSDINYTIFNFKNHKPIIVAKTLKYYEDILKEHNFGRIHQSYLVNRKFAIGIKNEQLLLSSSESLSISRKRKSIVDAWLKKND